jgi:hypothetical protein
MNPLVGVFHRVGKTEGRHVSLGHCGKGIAEEAGYCFSFLINVSTFSLAFEAKDIVLEFWRIFVQWRGPTLMMDSMIATVTKQEIAAFAAYIAVVVMIIL